jgi:hypothetical protein
LNSKTAITSSSTVDERGVHHNLISEKTKTQVLISKVHAFMTLVSYEAEFMIMREVVF